jgi:oligopeptide transport system substrate-binding protein
VQPDEELPKLVAHPMFRPVYGSGDYFEKDPIGADIVTNGAFRIASVGKDGVTLDREQKYFDRDKIKLERVRFVPSQDADAALAAYKSGEVDVVTNTSFEPLVLKLLAPFIDFRTTTHSALNFYEFNTAHAPFNDRRVREALAITIDRKQLTEDEMEGAAKPAFDFLPFDVGRETKIGNDPEKAKRLLETAGFPDAEGFPKIRLLINRNNVQELIARSIAEMWKSSLNIDTEIIVKDSKELAELRDAGEFDIVRRGVVLPTSDETANMLAIFAADKPGSDLQQDKTKQSQANASADSNSENSMSNAETDAGISNSVSEELLIDTGAEKEAILTEAEAIASIPAIPLYFPTSYSLVKPYVLGFEMNTLDAPSLKNVSIDNSWQPGSKGKQSEKNIR